MFTAPLILVILSLLVLTVLAAALVREVRRDGYGSRPAPSSHHAWDESWRPRVP